MDMSEGNFQASTSIKGSKDAIVPSLSALLNRPFTSLEQELFNQCYWIASHYQIQLDVISILFWEGFQAKFLFFLTILHGVCSEWIQGKKDYRIVTQSYSLFHPWQLCGRGTKTEILCEFLPGDHQMGSQIRRKANSQWNTRFYFFRRHGMPPENIHIAVFEGVKWYGAGLTQPIVCGWMVEYLWLNQAREKEWNFMRVVLGRKDFLKKYLGILYGLLKREVQQKCPLQGRTQICQDWGTPENKRVEFFW
ncbi:MAG: hypothetical protein GY795_14930, partial [Desulfobacterales bacterium]|nr:hypothetical protein [Desulfobacterales bacterium]